MECWNDAIGVGGNPDPGPFDHPTIPGIPAQSASDFAGRVVCMGQGGCVGAKVGWFEIEKNYGDCRAAGGNRPRAMSFRANSIWLGASSVVEALGSGPSKSS